VNPCAEASASAGCGAVNTRSLQSHALPLAFARTGHLPTILAGYLSVVVASAGSKALVVRVRSQL
jgi:hypothetical protein